MKVNKVSIVVLLVTLSLLMGPVAAYDIPAGSTNAYIQEKIDNASSGATITFEPGPYYNISLSINKALNLVGNGAVLNGISGGTIFNVLNTNWVNISGFTIIGGAYGINLTNVNNSNVTSNNISDITNYGINIADTGDLTSLNNLLIDNNRFINSTGGIHASGAGMQIANNYMNMYGKTSLNCIDGSNLSSLLIENNTMLNGGDAINIFQLYKNLTINNNVITNMTTNYGDAISLVNHDSNVETTTTTRVTNNVVDNAVYGIFLGGNFNGTISGNSITNTQFGMNITGKHNASLGSLNANITDNTITNTNIGIAMENPNVVYLNLADNTVYSTSDSLLKGYYYRLTGTLINNPDDNEHNNAWDDLLTNGGYWS